MAQAKDAKEIKYYIGIGSSAGGLEALSNLFPHLPKALGATYIVAQHLDPAHKSLLRDLLARTTDYPIHQIVDNMTPEAEQIYITPPGYNATLSGGRLKLSPASKAGPKPSVDMLFNSLAQEVGNKAIGIILSGTGSDGSKGVSALKEHGGLVLAQDSESAKYNGMPKSAIDTGLVDVVATPSKIGEFLSDITQNSITEKQLPNPSKMGHVYDRIFNALLKQTDCDFSDYKMNTIKRRIQRRMTVNRLNMLEDYAQLVERSIEETNSLFKDILISVTSFFRDKETFDELTGIIDKMVKEKKVSGQIRVWVPGCATGEEAYSIALLFTMAMRRNECDVPIQVFATDLDTDALDQARRGIFSETEIADIPPELVENFFTERDGYYFISKRIREIVVFARQDLVSDPPFSRLDLISCRNLLIYFNQKLQNQIIPMFNFVLKEGGYLALGKSENIGQFDGLFTPVSKTVRIFKRLAPAPDAGLPLMNRKHVGYGVNQSSEAKRSPQGTGHDVSYEELFNTTVLQKLAPNGVIIGRDLEVKHLMGDMSDYLSFPTGKMDTAIIRLLQDDIRIEIRAIIQKAKREGTTHARLIHRRSGNQHKDILVQVGSVKNDQYNDYLALTFNEISSFNRTSSNESEDTALDPRIQDLERELNATKEDLQTTIEELETTNEELQSTNEELQSANEELQSANEELQTANEELQSTNEELSTVNQELQVKTVEISEVNNDLENILQNAGIPLIVVDSRLRLTRYTSSAAKLFNLVGADMGQLVTTTSVALNIRDLRESLLSAIEEEETKQVNYTADDKSYELNIIPYLTDHEMIAGIILLFHEAKIIEEKPGA